MTKRDHAGDLASVLRESVLEASRAIGLGPRICLDLAEQTEERFRLRAAGTGGYVGKVDRRRRDAEIRSKFTGGNERDLAKEYNLSPRRVQQIVGGGV